ncbi:ABC transporter ATP-binding protein [Paracoccaceae bacterium]|nr:ABC transporter ATP-binding protein [Paracoccaceae bacterium]
MRTELTELGLEVQNLHKVYSSYDGGEPVIALKNLSLQVKKGSFFGLLGPNGAGKSTLINILAGLVIKTSGKVKIRNIDQDINVREFKRSIGVVPQETNFDPFLTPYESLDIQAGLYGVRKSERNINQLLKRLGLEGKSNAYMRSLSGGMRRRLLIGKALVHAPKVVILDEPTAGVDIELREMLWDYMKDLNANGTTIILTTHYLEEAQALCEKIAILNKGQLIACNDTSDLLARVNLKVINIKHSNVNLKKIKLPDKASLKENKNQRLSISYDRNEIKTDQLLDSLRSQGIEIMDLSTEEADLADVFRLLTKNN